MQINKLLMIHKLEILKELFLRKFVKELMVPMTKVRLWNVSSSTLIYMVVAVFPLKSLLRLLRHLVALSSNMSLPQSLQSMTKITQVSLMLKSLQVSTPFVELVTTPTSTLSLVFVKMSQQQHWKRSVMSSEKKVFMVCVTWLRCLESLMQIQMQD